MESRVSSLGKWGSVSGGVIGALLIWRIALRVYQRLVGEKRLTSFQRLMLASPHLKKEVEESLGNPEGRFPHLRVNRKGMVLHTRFWEIFPLSEVKGIVYIVHGLAEHCGRYEHVARAINEGLGMSVYSMDHQGHGRSEGERLWVDKFADYVDDYQDFIEENEAALEKRGVSKDLPRIIIGHSMGGHIAIRVILGRNPDFFTASVLTGPMIIPDSATAKPHLVALAKVLRNIFPRLVLDKLNPEFSSRSPLSTFLYRTDPLRSTTGMRVHVAVELLNTMETLPNLLENFKTPVLVMHGTMDRLTNYQGSELFIDKISSKKKHLRLYPGHYHELFFEPHEDSSKILNTVIEWLSECIQSS